MSSRLGIAGIVLLAAFGLAACGGGGSPLDRARDDLSQAQAALAAAQAAQAAAEARATAAEARATEAETAQAAAEARATAAEAAQATAEAAQAAAEAAQAAAEAAQRAAEENTQEARDAAAAAEAAKTAAEEAKAAAEAAQATAETRATNAEAARDAAVAARMKAEEDLAAAERKAAEAREAADRAKALATAKSLYAALGPPASGENANALGNIAAPTLAAAGLTIDAAAGAGALPDGTDPASVVLKAGASAGSLGGWAGMDYAHMDTGTKIKNEARVYTNKGPGTRLSFGSVHNVISGQQGENAKNNGYTVVSTSENLGRVMAPALTHSGTQTHAKTNGTVTFRGTYDGAQGQYRCSGDAACTSTNDGSGSPSALGGTWHFKPDAGATVHRPDANYLYFGWWVSKDKAGDPTAASAFKGVVGDVDGEGASVSGSDVTGSATYAGKAAGKFAITGSLNNTDAGGHFTADATLTAKFGSNEAPNNGGVTGTINNFRLNDGSEDAGWSVELKRGTWGDSGAINAPTGTNVGTVWSINGNKAAASGTWSGTVYDEMPGNAPDGDGSNVPTTVTGTFYSEFGSIGRMVGAFGASKQ